MIVVFINRDFYSELTSHLLLAGWIDEAVTGILGKLTWDFCLGKARGS